MNIVIVGGGIIGVVASILLKRANHQVTVIEKSKKLGGLLNSLKVEEEVFLDFGSHIPRETGIVALDDVLFNKLPLSDWNKYRYANVGNYFSNIINTQSQFIDVSTLDSEIYTKGLGDLFQGYKNNEELLDEKNSLYNHFGETFGKKVYEPLLRKLFGDIVLSELEPKSHNLFGYSRVIVGKQEFTEKLKELPYLDERIAYPKNSINYGTKHNYYPKKTGIFHWIDHLVKEAEKIGVIFLTDEYITELQIEHKKLRTNKDSMLNFDKLIWTLPKDLLEDLLEGETSQKEPLRFRGVNIIHFKYEGKLTVKNHYIYCNDSDMKTFRVTLYDNLTQTKTNWCTVEVLGDKLDCFQTIFGELKSMQLLEENTELKDYKAVYVKNGFPIPYKRNNGENLKLDTDNIILLNKDADNFFMEDLLIKMFKEISMRKLIL